MTRASKRKSDLQSPASDKIPRVDSVRSASNKDAKKGYQRIDAIYNKYANKSSGMIESVQEHGEYMVKNEYVAIDCLDFLEMVIWSNERYLEGIEALCSDIEVDYTDVRILMLAWKMNAQTQGYFTQDEWRRGLKALRIDTINKLKKALPELEKEVLKSENFEDFYNYAFHYCLTEEKQKCLDIESTCILIDLVLGFQYQPQVDSFIKFLKIQSDYKVMNKDQWTNFLRFCQEISFPDLQNYDICGAWPVLLDNFVDWLKQKVM
ncbi:hypothetical protein OROGR_006393 [Orobanche gracilis]